MPPPLCLLLFSCTKHSCAGFRGGGEGTHEFNLKMLNLKSANGGTGFMVFSCNVCAGATVRHLHALVTLLSSIRTDGFQPLLLLQTNLRIRSHIIVGWCKSIYKCLLTTLCQTSTCSRILFHCRPRHSTVWYLSMFRVAISSLTSRVSPTPDSANATLGLSADNLSPPCTHSTSAA